MRAMIELDNVSVCYQLPNERIKSIKEYIIHRLKRQMEYHMFHALKKVSVSVNEGEVLGIIGHNGAGKSTLLKVVARVLRPTTGRVILRGRVFPLLELGAGFDMELTGRENVYLNSAILGFKKADVTARFKRIVEFAGLEEFIDTPVRNYSTGMVSRLGFAIATDVQPEVLIVDEVLSVGDAEFQQRSSERMKKFCQQGATVLMVSHNLEPIKKICNRLLWLDHGAVKAYGHTEEILQQYMPPQA